MDEITSGLLHKELVRIADALQVLAMESMDRQLGEAIRVLESKGSTSNDSKYYALAAIVRNERLDRVVKMALALNDDAVDEVEP